MDPGSVGQYTTERGDVLLSVQLILIREAERGAAALEPASGSTPARRDVAASVGSWPAPVAPPAPVTALAAPAELEVPSPAVAGAVGASAPEPQEPGVGSAVLPLEHDPAPASARPLTSVPVQPTPVRMAGPPTWTGMTDAALGTPGVSALRRDLVLEQAWPTARTHRPVVVVTTVETRDERRVAPREADHLTKAMWELAVEHLGPKDRCYRTGPCQLSAILRGGDGRSSEDLVATLESALAGAIEGRVRGATLRVTSIEAAEAVRRLAALHWADEVHHPDAQAGGGLASAV